MFEAKRSSLSFYPGGLMVSPDGRWVYYARNDRKASNIVQTSFSP